MEHWINPGQLPYLLQRVEHSKQKHAFLPLNRDYVPLGFRRADGFVNYSDAEIIGQHAVYFSRDPSTIEGVWWNRDGHGRHWLYDDSTASRVDYFARLEKLMSRQMEMVGATPVNHKI